MKVRMTIDRLVLDGFDPALLNSARLEAQLRDALTAELAARLGRSGRARAAPGGRKTRREYIRVAFPPRYTTGHVSAVLGGALVDRVWSGGDGKGDAGLRSQGRG